MKRHGIEDRGRGGEVKASNKGREESRVGCIDVYAHTHTPLCGLPPLPLTGSEFGGALLYAE